MKTTMATCLAALVLGLAACGSDDEESASSGAAAGAAPSGGNAQVAQAAKDGCLAGITNNPAIDASKQEGLTAECEKVAEAAGTGDKGKLKTAYDSYCGKLAEALPEAARAQAESACKQGAAAIGG